jgi:hypothetical protein
MPNETYDYSRLIGRIVEVFRTRSSFGAAMGWSNVTLTQKIKGRHWWRQDEISLACELLNIGDEEIGAYFFVKKSNA